MEKAMAKKLIDELVKCQKMLDAAEVVAREIADHSEQTQIRTAIMQASGSLYVEVMMAIIREYPDLDPHSDKRASKA